MEKNTFDAAWIATLPAQVQTFLNGRNTKGDVYAYDWAYRLVDARYDVTNPLQEVQNPGSQPFVKNVAYTLDGLGNRSQVLTTPPTPPSTVTYAADVVNQYTAVGGVARTHDNNGNPKDDGTYVFSYDFENRLVQVRQSGTLTLIADYHYDALGRRVEKVLAAGTTTRYLLDGVEVVEEYDAVGNWQARYVYEDGIDHPRCMDRADIADVNGNQNTTEVLRFHYHQQALGSVTEVTQPTGAVVEWVTYDIYGLPTIRDQQGNMIPMSAVRSPYLFASRRYDPESVTYHFRRRQYCSARGRFLQRDPSGYVDGCSLYEYVRSEPVNLTDPMGRQVQREVRQLRGELDRARERVRQARVALEDAERELARVRRALEQARAREAAAKARLAGAQRAFWTAYRHTRGPRPAEALACGRHILSHPDLWPLLANVLAAYRAYAQAQAARGAAEAEVATAEAALAAARRELANAQAAEAAARGHLAARLHRPDAADEGVMSPEYPSDDRGETDGSMGFAFGPNGPAEELGVWRDGDNLFLAQRTHYDPWATAAYGGTSGSIQVHGTAIIYEVLGTSTVVTLFIPDKLGKPVRWSDNHGHSNLWSALIGH